MAQVDRPTLERHLVGTREIPALGRFLDAFSDRVDLDLVELGQSSSFEAPMVTGLHRDKLGDVRPVHQIIPEMVRVSGETDEINLHYMVYRDERKARQVNDSDFHLVISGISFMVNTSVVGLTTARFPYAEMLGSLQAAIMGPRPASSQRQ